MGLVKKKPLSERLARVVALGRDKGCLTYEELNNLLPEDVASPEEIDELLTLLGKEHIEIVDKPSSAPSRAAAEGSEEAEQEEVPEPPELKQAITMLTKQIEATFPGLPNARWVALRLLDGDERISEAVRTGELGDLRPSTADTPSRLDPGLEVAG